MMDVLDEKQEKKKAIKERNKRDFHIFQHLRQLRQERARVDELEDAITVTATPTEEPVVWSAKTQEIKNRLTDKKRMAKERWNRFAATSDSGGRGL